MNKFKVGDEVVIDNLQIQNLSGQPKVGECCTIASTFDDGKNSWYYLDDYRTIMNEDELRSKVLIMSEEIQECSLKVELSEQQLDDLSEIIIKKLFDKLKNL